MRRQILIIAGMTALVLGSVVVLGPSMLTLSRTAPSRANSIPIPMPGSSRQAETEPPPAPVPQVGVEVVDAVSGARVENNAVVELMGLDGAMVDFARGAWSGTAIGFEDLPPVPLFVCTSLAGYLAAQSGPIIPTGMPQTVQVSLTPIYVVTMRPRFSDGDRAAAIRVVSTTPPTWPARTPWAEWCTLGAAGVTFALTPGRYWCQVTERYPREHPDNPDRVPWLSWTWLVLSPGHPTHGRDFLFEFEVVDSPLTFEPDVIWPTGGMSIAGRVKDSAARGIADTPVTAIRLGPGPIRHVAAQSQTDVKGAFLLSGLTPGFYRVECAATPAGPQACWIGELRAGEAVSAITLVAGERPDNQETTRRGSAEIRILRRGKPVKGARIQIEGWGTLASGFWTDLRRPRTFAGETDDDGRLLVTDVQARNYVVRPISPQTMQLFELQIWPDETLKVEWEIAPSGTAEFQGFLRLEGADLLWTTLTSRDGKQHLFWHPDEQGTIDVCGITPGAYTFSASDSESFEYRYDLIFKADETLAFEGTQATAAVVAAAPYFGFWKRGASVEFVPDAGGGTRPRRWDYGERELEWDSSINIQQLPRTKFRLVARAGGRAVAVAAVDTTAGDVFNLDWVALWDAAGATLVAEYFLSLSDSRNVRATLSLSREGLPEIVITGQQMLVDRTKLVATFVGVPAGEWTISIEAEGRKTLTQHVTTRQGETLTFALERPEQANSATSKDRPIGGVTIKLPTPSPTQVGPPSEPPLPPAEKVLPPLPPIPYRTDAPLEGREVYLFCEGADINLLWAASVWMSGSKARAVLGVAERSSELSIELVLYEGRQVIVVAGLNENFRTLTIQLPGHAALDISLTEDVDSYTAEFGK